MGIEDAVCGGGDGVRSCRGGLVLFSLGAKSGAKSGVDIVLVCGNKVSLWPKLKSFAGLLDIKAGSVFAFASIFLKRPLLGLLGLEVVLCGDMNRSERSRTSLGVEFGVFLVGDCLGVIALASVK